MARYVTFGELMLRLTPPGREMLFQTPCLSATFGGAEANVAVSLANYGESVSFVSALPENPLGTAALRDLHSFGVNTPYVRRCGERLGIYYAEMGSAMRPSKVVYDRAHSSFASVERGDFDWDSICAEASWFHTTGITPAVSRGAAESVLDALAVAKKKGLTVSCDLNYRKKLWNWGVEPQRVMRQIASFVDVMIANEEDCQKCLGIASDADVASGRLSVESYKELAGKVMSAFPNVKYLAVSLRESVSADWNNWSVFLASQDQFYVSKKYEIRNIVDRIGGGDAFGSGLIWGLNHLEGLQDVVEFAAAASALKHTIYGDFNRVTTDDVLALMSGDVSGRVQR